MVSGVPCGLVACILFHCSLGHVHTYVCLYAILVCPLPSLLPSIPSFPPSPPSPPSPLPAPWMCSLTFEFEPPSSVFGYSSHPLQPGGDKIVSSIRHACTIVHEGT